MQSIQLLHLLAAGAIGYLLGSIPFGLIITRLAGQGDVRNIGSGNIGATNVLRTGSKPLAAATLAGDLLKGTAAVFAGHALSGGDGALIAGLLSFLGHLFPVWLKFRGGKGVATYIGVLLGLTWPLAALFCATWLLVAVLSRYSSLSALTGSVAATLYAAFAGNSYLFAIIAIMTIFIFLRHRANITRLLNGEETRIGR